MKKLFTLVLAGLLTAALTVAASAEYAVLEEVAPDAVAAGMFGDSYPYSVDYDWPECTSDPVITGTVITGMPASGSHCWSNGTDNASCAFDGDTQTFFDPSEATTESWCGLKLDQAYELSEVRICNRSGQEVRIIGAAIQGSNDDGETWCDVVYFDPEIYGSSALLTNDYHIVTPEKNDAYIEIYTEYMTEEQADFSVYWVGNGSYSMYRYVNLVGTHGDCAEIELYGHPAEAKNSDKGSITIIKDDLDNFGHDYETTDVEAAVTDGSIAGIVIGGGGAYSDSASYACAFDGDDATFYDPATAGPSCFTGIQTSEPYALTSVKVLPRDGWHSRTLGATIQGSNDGHAWTTLASFAAEDILADDAERVFLTKEITDTNGYTMFRYVSDGQSHGDVAEVCFYGAPAAAAAAEEPVAEEPAVEEVTYTYPASGASENIIAGNVIGNATGWGDNAEAGAAAAFDGNPATFFDPLGVGDGFCGMEAAEPMILDKVAILSRDGWADRFAGAMIQGSNDGENWTTLYTADAPAASTTEYTVITEFENNTGYTQFRYYNETNHGDVAEVEFYGTAVKVEEAPAVEEVVEVVAPVEEVEAAPAPAEEAPQTFDAAIIAAVAAIVSAAGYAISKKH